jgi:hypothetical protein
MGEEPRKTTEMPKDENDNLCGHCFREITQRGLFCPFCGVKLHARLLGQQKESIYTPEEAENLIRADRMRQHETQSYMELSIKYLKLQKEFASLVASFEKKSEAEGYMDEFKNSLSYAQKVRDEIQPVAVPEGEKPTETHIF